MGQRSSGVIQTEVVVNRVMESLFAAQVTLGSLNRCVAEQELDLFQFSTRQMAQPGAGAAQIVRGKVFDAGPLRSTLDNMPDRLRRESQRPKVCLCGLLAGKSCRR
jgi:hypothetical protein